MTIEQHQVKLKEGEKHCKYCHGLGFVFCCRAPDDCEEFICEECNRTGIHKKDKNYKLSGVDNMPLLGVENDIDLKMYNLTGSLDP